MSGQATTVVQPLFKILRFNRISPVGLDALPGDRFEVASEFVRPDAILLRSHVLVPDAIADSVLAIARAGAGVNNIPLAYCTERGIPVFNTPGANANAVKELVAAGLLLASRGILEGVRFVQSLDAGAGPVAMQRALEDAKMRFAGRELHGKTLGVVGLGAIGSQVAELGLTLGMSVIGYDPALSVEAAWRLPRSVQRADTLAGLFLRSDYVSLHLPSLPSTRGLISSELLEMLPAGGCLLNFARPEIVQIPAIVAALDGGHLRRYISDFPEPELIARDDVILMPHIGASTAEAEDNCALMAAQQLRDFLENGNTRCSVNFPTLALERTDGARLAIANRNVPKILGSILAILAERNINVIDMLNKSREDVAYNLIDISVPPDAASLDAMRAIDGVVNVRLVT